jgi:hypothetical protein
MRQKVSTLLDETLYRRARLEAIRQDRQISEILESALRDYLTMRKTPGDVGGVAERTFGAIALEPAAVQRILEEEDGLFDA